MMKLPDSNTPTSRGYELGDLEINAVFALSTQRLYRSRRANRAMDRYMSAHEICCSLEDIIGIPRISMISLVPNSKAFDCNPVLVVLSGSGVSGKY